jgi:hypothetical protein
MKNLFYLFILPFFTVLSAKAQTTLTSGDVAVIYHLSLTTANGTGGDRIGLVLLVDITANTVFKVTENGSNGTQLDTDEGIITITATSAHAAGKVINITLNAGSIISSTTGFSYAISGGNPYAISQAGDQTIVYTGVESNPTFIFSAHFEGTNWLACNNGSWPNACGGNQSNMPASGVTFTFGSTPTNEYDVNWYSGPLPFLNRADALSKITNISNWTGNNEDPPTTAETAVIALETQGNLFNPPAPPVVLTCPTNTTTTACQTQAAVNTAFATWLATASGTGGCNGVLTNNNTGAPSACGGSTTVTFTYTSTCAPLVTTCQATFTVAAAPTVVLTCPTNTTTTACQTQAAVNTAFATWLATASASGGCNGALTNNNTGAPSACGGSTTVTFTYTSTCAPLVTTCQATFTVAAAPTVVLTCPTNTTAAACQTQTVVDAAFATWLSSASASGGCNGALSNNSTGAPPACGGSTTVTFTYSSTCAPTTTTCTATYTVAAPPTVTLSCPTNQTVAAGQTQAAINAAFATWLATANASGGCNGALTNNNTGAPPATGGSTTVSFTYTSTCAPLTTSCQATFTVSDIILTCPTNTTTAACQTQADVNTDFATWLATASGTGGCGGVLSNNNTGAPSACGGSRTVTFTYTSTCAPLTTTCQSTYTVPAAPPVVLTCPTNTTAAACQTQAAVNTAFTTWLAIASASGGCNGVLTNNSTVAPSACGGSTTVTFTYTSTCAPFVTTCQATFTVAAAPTVVLTCPTNTTTAACQTQAAVNTAFATWLATASASGGCNGVLTNNSTIAPSACGGSTTVIFTYTSTCAPLVTTCQATFTVAAAPTVVLTCPTNTTAAACQTQTAVNAAFTTWLATASGTGGCNGALTNNNTGAPPACGGSTTVTFTYTSTCAPFITTCQATFTVAAAQTFVLTCPTNTTTAACQTQTAVNAAFATWLATAIGTGGCNGEFTNNNTGAPPACGGSTTVTFTYLSTCAPFFSTCQATFTVAAAPTVTLTCPTNTMTGAGQTQAAVNASFATWLSTASASGGCNGMFTNNNVGAPPATGGSTTVTFTYTSTCAPLTTTCQSIFTVQAGVAQIGMQVYVTLQDAINAATPGQTIMLIAPVSEANLNISNSVIIDANAFTLTIPSGNLTIPTGNSLTWLSGNLIIASGANIDNDGTLSNNGNIDYNNPTAWTNTGLYKGTGTFNGSITNNGTFSPGN